MLKYTLKNDDYSIEMPGLVLGTANIDRQDNDEGYFEIFDRYCELGGSCLDTARVYCNWIEGGDGASEQVIGRWMEKRGNRSDILIATKGGHPYFTEEETIHRIDEKSVTEDLGQSLEALKTDYTDIYMLHRDDTSVPVEEIMPYLDKFVKSGKVHILGASNWSAARIAKANKFALKNGLTPFSVSQINYSLAHSSADILGDDTQVSMDMREYMWYEKNHFPVMAFSPQAKGFFSKLAAGQSATNQLESSYATTANLARLAKVKRLSDKTGYSPAVITLAYLNSQPFPTASVFAVSKLWQLEEDMTAQDIVFDERTVAFLENLYDE
ncbi:aldo/keto reductase [Ruminococcus sp. NK3A76]|uniref:aldo/keto reductase n=1 Tax=Ruminococcus sp. NK3A76 TaxID=877411 RepID=UPI00048B9971|nr:aldo/keto reductase [Ruminococcus sp. NK3A76]